MTWTSPDPWECYQCGATGIGGRPAGESHAAIHATPPPAKPGPKGVVPESVVAADVRAWAIRKGWVLGSRGRMPQAAIDAYLATAKPRTVIDMDVVDELRALGNSTVQIAQRLGVTVGAINKAVSRRRPT